MSTFSYLFNSSYKVSIFVFSKSPMSVGIMLMLVVLLRMLAYFLSIDVKAVHIVYKCDVVVGITMRLIKFNALF